ncbi:substrate-binding domain-containing protein [Microtetraspora sp. NBRC 16547]|uniref:substrate-binding domain-containing protein n=1 Tax=Microtetraspora sp. NBRC 16547 TaxID=3030993 RepID=UPI0024A0DA96|nr:substrate-binding domain-containing protein [Microtetraspora sp. NBRC 16547]GLW99289.1 LacI family transcriptional regulator [Microtetraspora sp. NBRC 16547]
MSVEHRHSLILRQVRARGSVRLTDLAEELGVSAVTLRRDVEHLAAQGLLMRVHGGVTLPPSYAADPISGPATSTAKLTIGMLVPSAHYYYPDVIKGAQEQAARAGARLVLGISRYEDDEDRAQVRQLIKDGIDGLLLTPSRQPDESHVEWLAGLHVPTVLVERRAELAGPASMFDAVASDHAHGAYLGVRHLAELGHRRLALVAYASPTTPRIRAGVLAGAQALGMDRPAEIVIDRERPLDLFIADVLRLVRKDGVTGLIVHNDEDALSLVRNLGAAGVDIPAEVSLVAYDDEVASFCSPSLTAVAPPKVEVGRCAVNMLVRRLTQGSSTSGRHLALLPELRVRESSAAPR